MENNYPINMKIQSAHLQMVSNKCTNFQKKSMHSLRTYMDKIVSTDGGQIDGQTDRV